MLLNLPPYQWRLSINDHLGAHRKLIERVHDLLHRSRLPDDREPGENRKVKAYLRGDGLTSLLVGKAQLRPLCGKFHLDGHILRQSGLDDGEPFAAVIRTAPQRKGKLPACFQDAERFRCGSLRMFHVRQAKSARHKVE